MNEPEQNVNCIIFSLNLRMYMARNNLSDRDTLLLSMFKQIEKDIRSGKYRNDSYTFHFIEMRSFADDCLKSFQLYIPGHDYIRDFSIDLMPEYEESGITFLMGKN